MSLFLLLLAWPMALFCTFVLAFSIHHMLTYKNSLEYQLHKMNGYSVRMPLWWPAAGTLIGWAWIIARPL